MEPVERSSTHRCLTDDHGLYADAADRAAEEVTMGSLRVWDFGIRIGCIAGALGRHGSRSNSAVYESDHRADALFYKIIAYLKVSHFLVQLILTSPAQLLFIWNWVFGPHRVCYPIAPLEGYTVHKLISTCDALNLIQEFLTIAGVMVKTLIPSKVGVSMILFVP